VEDAAGIDRDLEKSMAAKQQQLGMADQAW